jgi:hypothetical protein
LATIDTHQSAQNQESQEEDPLVNIQGPITRARAQRIKNAITSITQNLWNTMLDEPRDKRPTHVQVIQASCEEN